MYSTCYVNIYIYSSSCTVHGMLIFTFTVVHVQYMVHYFLHLQQFKPKIGKNAPDMVC